MKRRHRDSARPKVRQAIPSSALLPSSFLLEWTPKEESAEDAQQWEDNWDDDNVEDEFSLRLKYVCRTHTRDGQGKGFFKRERKRERDEEQNCKSRVM